MRVRERERAGATDRQSESLRESLVLERGECLSVRAIHSCFVYSVHCVLERGERGTDAGAGAGECFAFRRSMKVNKK